jgi:hypothetical protein
MKQEECSVGFHICLTRGHNTFYKFVENSIKIAVLDEHKRDPGIDLRIARRNRQSGVVLEPGARFVEIPIEGLFLTALRFVISYAPIQLFPCGYRQIITDDCLHVHRTWHVGKKSFLSSEIC